MDNLLPPQSEGVFFDTETTGIPDWKQPSHYSTQPHMTQIAALHVDLNTSRIIQSMNVVIKPDGWIIPDECVELNGITTEYAMSVGIPEFEAFAMFLAMALGRKRFAFNTTFDNRIIRIGTKRYFENSTQEAWKAGEYECQMIRAKKFLKLKKNPKLADAYQQICGMELVGAHDAMIDITATMELYFAMNNAEATDADMFA